MSLPIKNLPRFPDAPAQYEQAYMNNLLKTLDTFIRELNNPGPLQGSSINLSHLPVSAVGLRKGDLWNNAGVVNIVP